MKIRELQTILDGQPSVSRSTFLVGSLYILCIILALAFLILGIGLLLESFFHFKIFLDWISRSSRIPLNEDQRWSIATTLGILSLMLSAVFAGTIMICRMVLRRNHFIITIEDWVYQNIKDINRPSVSRSRK